MSKSSSAFFAYTGWSPAVSPLNISLALQRNSRLHLLNKVGKKTTNLQRFNTKNLIRRT